MRASFKQISILVLAMTVPALAQPRDEWARVKGLRAGVRITIVQSDTTSLKGQFERASDTEVVVASDSGAESAVAKSAVRKISRDKASRRVTNAILLGAVGGLAGAGALRFGVACAETNDGCRNVLLTAVAGAAAGAVIGALLPTSEEIYRARKK